MIIRRRTVEQLRRELAEARQVNLRMAKVIARQEQRIEDLKARAAELVAQRDGDLEW